MCPFSMIVKLIFFFDDLCNAYRGNTVINNTRQHAHLNRNDDKDNQDASHIALDSNYFRLENNSDIHIDSYLPIKQPFEQALYQTYLIDDMTSIDMASLAVSVYLANHIMSQQHDVTLGIHVPSHLPNDFTRKYCAVNVNNRCKRCMSTFYNRF